MRERTELSVLFLQRVSLAKVIVNEEIRRTEWNDANHRHRVASIERRESLLGCLEDDVRHCLADVAGLGNCTCAEGWRRCREEQPVRTRSSGYARTKNPHLLSPAEDFQGKVFPRTILPAKQLLICL